MTTVLLWWRGGTLGLNMTTLLPQLVDEAAGECGIGRFALATRTERWSESIAKPRRKESEMKEILELGMGFIGIVIMGVLLATLPTFWLWNSLMPELFSLPTITFWQALGLVVLARCLIPTASSK